MSVVRIEALEALARLIELAIPELEGHICVGQAPSGEMEQLPNISINPGRWDYAPDQESQHATLPGNIVVYDVGDHTCSVVISVMAASPRQRAVLEAQVLDLFQRQKHPLSDFRMPGTIMIAVAEIPELSEWVVTFDLDSDEWIDGLAMDRRYESKILATCTIPALTIDEPVYTIQQLILGVQVRLGRATAVDLVTINEDGSIAPFAP